MYKRLAIKVILAATLVTATISGLALKVGKVDHNGVETEYNMHLADKEHKAALLEHDARTEFLRQDYETAADLLEAVLSSLESGESVEITAINALRDSAYVYTITDGRSYECRIDKALKENIVDGKQPAVSEGTVFAWEVVPEETTYVYKTVKGKGAVGKTSKDTYNVKRDLAEKFSSYLEMVQGYNLIHSKVSTQLARVIYKATRVKFTNADVDKYGICGLEFIQDDCNYDFKVIEKRYNAALETVEDSAVIAIKYLMDEDDDIAIPTKVMQDKYHNANIALINVRNNLGRTWQIAGKKAEKAEKAADPADEDY